MTDQAGTLTTEYAYTPYGETTITPLAAGHIDQPYRYTGQHQDPTGLYKMGLRYYNPELSRWTQPDPAVSINNLAFGNTYLYAGNNPLNFIDPNGAFDTEAFIRDAGTGIFIGIVCTPFGIATTPVGGFACGAALSTGAAALYSA